MNSTRWTLALLLALSAANAAAATPGGDACCLPGDTPTCVAVNEASCLQAGGLYTADDCGNVVCPLLGPCCMPDLMCMTLPAIDCAAAGGVIQMGPTTCANTVCPVIGACCMPDGSCVESQTQGACNAAGGTYEGFGTRCATVVCTGACCDDLNDTCADGVAPADCAGAYLGNGTACADGCFREVICMQYSFDQNMVDPATPDVTLQIPKFDTMGGTRELLQVEVRSSIRLLAVVRLTNTGTGGDIDTEVMQTEDLLANFPAFGAPVVDLDFMDVLDCGGLLPPQMTCDFGGPITTPFIVPAAATTDQGVLASFEGAGTNPYIVTGSGFFSYIGGGLFDLTQAPHVVEGSVKVIYEFRIEGACCLDDGTCVIESFDNCDKIGGDYQGDLVPCTPDPCFVAAERAHPGWNWVDNAITLTANEPTYWSVLTGDPKGVSPFTVLDPGTPPGRPAVDGSNDRVLRGYVVGWAVNQDGHEIRWNHLKGEGTIVNYRDQAAWEYNTWSHAVVDPAVGHGDALPEPGVLRMDGSEYSLSFDQVLLNFQAAGSDGFSGPIGSGFVIETDTDLTLFPPSADLRQNSDGPVTTKASMDIWNENETKFSGTHRCITCWDQTLISNYDAPNSFLYPFLQTDHGKARIDGHAANECNVLDDPDTPQDESVTSILSPLLGVYARLLTMAAADGCEAASGSNLIGLGVDDTAVIRYDVSGGGGPPEGQWPEPPRGAPGVGPRRDREAAPAPLLGSMQDRVSGSEKGSLVFFSKVELRWDSTPPFDLVQDTFLSLTNDFPQDVRVQLYFINGDPPLAAP